MHYRYPFRKINRKENVFKTGKKKGTYLKDIRSDNFIENVHFKHIVDLYIFDKKLKMLCMDAIERIEISLRSRISYYLGEQSPYSYIDASRFMEKSKAKHKRWLSKHEELIKRSKDRFIEHNRNKYGLPLRVWVACEIWDFGALSNLYSCMKPDDKLAISQLYNIDDGLIFASWLRSLNYLRNICAHHSRLWNLNIVDQPKLFSKQYKPSWVSTFLLDNSQLNTHKTSRVAPLLFILAQLMFEICPRSTWFNRLTDHLEHSFPDIKDLGFDHASMGFSNNMDDWSHLK